jgi:hypothetical protein
MTATLLDQFLAEECTRYVRRLLTEAIADTAIVRPHFEFNRFEVTVDRIRNGVIIEDVLDPSDAGSQTVTINEFLNALDRCAAERRE